MSSPSLSCYRLTGPVHGTLMDATMLVSHNPETGQYLCHAPITAEMFHAALASGAVPLTPDAACGGMPVSPTPGARSPLRLVRETA